MLPMPIVVGVHFIMTWNQEGRAMNAEKIDYVVALIIGFIERQVGDEKF